MNLNNDPYWICGAIIFSGRRDPTWLVNEEQAQNFFNTWSSLPVSEKHVNIPGILGYKGCYLSTNKSDRWISFRGIVTLLKEGRIIESRIDKNRTFEKALLNTAPNDWIPRAMLIEEFR